MIIDNVDRDLFKKTLEDIRPDASPDVLKAAMDKIANRIEDMAEMARHLDDKDEVLCMFADLWQAYSRDTTAGNFRIDTHQQSTGSVPYWVPYFTTGNLGVAYDKARKLHEKFPVVRVYDIERDRPMYRWEPYRVRGIRVAEGTV